MSEILDWANGFVIVYDVCDRASFTSSIETINTIRAHCKNSAGCSKSPIILIGNKCDLQAGRQVTSMEASLVAERAKVDFFEVSRVQVRSAVAAVLLSTGCLS